MMSLFLRGYGDLALMRCNVFVTVTSSMFIYPKKNDIKIELWAKNENQMVQELTNIDIAAWLKAPELGWDAEQMGNPRGRLTGHVERRTSSESSWSICPPISMQLRGWRRAAW